MRLREMKRGVVACVVAGALLSAVPAMAAFDAYISITGTRQGRFKGEAMSERLPVTSVRHDVTMTSGMVTGRRQHGQITIDREVDQASPMFIKAMDTHEALSDVTITFTTGAGAGKARVQTLNLKDAMITSVRVSGRTEAITIEYSTVMVTWTNGGKTATDDWEAPV